MHGPTTLERQLMTDWIRDLSAFVGNEQDYEYGTSKEDDYKVITPEGNIEVQKDGRWVELLDLMNVFAG